MPLQSPNTRFRFPKGIGIRLEAHKQVWLNSHLKNFETSPVTPDIRFNFIRAKKGSVKHYAEGMIIGNSIDIAIPPGGDQTLTAEFTVPVNLNAVLRTTHQHRLGTYGNIQLDRPDGGFDTIYENFDWKHPVSYWPDPPIRLEKGRKVRFTCRWHNTDAQVVRFGPKTTDEMCAINGFYYRDEGDTEVAGAPQCIPSKSGLFCIFAPKAGP